MSAFAVIGERLPVVFPVHPLTRQKLAGTTVPPSIMLVEPLGYLDFLALQADAAIVVTDSGGVREETTALGVPCVTARATTERPITVTEGTNGLAGADPAAVLAVSLEVLAAPPAPRCPALWDGKAGLRVADAVEELLGAQRWLRPTELRR
jgi:UDP-N-acetylglucosamine 2-epimerase (non-hydrolysing)